MNFINKYKNYLILGLVLIISLVINVCSIKSCSNYKEQNNNNIIALTDTIHYYTTNTGKLVASKTLLEGDLNTLKLANDSLYNVIKDMKVKKPNSVVYVSGTVVNELHDTVWSIVKDINNDTIHKDFAFNNTYRALEGFVEVVDTTLGLQITKDQYNFDYTVVVDKDNKVYIESSNPYVKYNNITGIQLPQPKRHKYGITIGPAIFGGINPNNGKGVWGIGGSVVIGWTPFSW